MPMKCPDCHSQVMRTTVTNGMLPDHIVRRRACLACGHAWFTVEAAVPVETVGWSPKSRKPVLLMPVVVEAGGER